MAIEEMIVKVGGQAVLGRQPLSTTPWLTERHGYDPTLGEGGAGKVWEEIFN
ncbi:hypothetical protein AAOGI_44770 [Agarivorans albus]